MRRSYLLLLTPYSLLLTPYSLLLTPYSLLLTSYSLPDFSTKEEIVIVVGNS